MKIRQEEKSSSSKSYETLFVQYKYEQKKKLEFRIRAGARARKRSSVIQIKKPNERTNKKKTVIYHPFNAMCSRLNSSKMCIDKKPTTKTYTLSIELKRGKKYKIALHFYRNLFELLCVDSSI